MSRFRTDKRRRLLARWGFASVFVTLAVSLVTVKLSRPRGQAIPAAGADIEGLTSVLERRPDSSDVSIRFEDITDRVGIDFRHMPTPRSSLLPEDMGSGVACGDYDNDGFADLFFVNISGPVLPGAEHDALAGRARLYRNVGGTWFEDVTEAAGVGFVGCGMGAAWGDYDNDGDLDLYVTSFGGNVLYRNGGDGTFRDVTSATGTADNRFGTGCSWGDYDRDGNLDLYVCNYVAFVYSEADRRATEPQYGTEQPFTLNPSAYLPQPNSLFRNRGDGTFDEVAAQVGVADPNGRSLSASWVDLDNDGWLDLYVANDVSSNGVFRNRGDGTFEDVGAASLAADYRGAMGIAVGDFDHDLDPDLFITHWIAQENALYRNMTDDAFVGRSEKPLWFMDVADTHGLGQISLDMVGWAAGFADFDNDGWSDLWVINGSTMETDANHAHLAPQPALLFRNQGADGFVNIAAEASPFLGTPRVGRGGAHVDWDRDGRLDLVVVTHGGSAAALRNVSNVGNWLRLHLRQQEANTMAIGARAYVRAGGQVQMAAVGTSSSYLSQDESCLHFGLGDADRVEHVRIVWPDGMEEHHSDLSINQEITYFRNRSQLGSAGGAVAHRGDYQVGSSEHGK